jgi:putative ABC transport system permease protein
VSESFGFRYGYSTGDSLTLSTLSGARPFRVAGVVRDYALDLGTILVDYEAYQRLWNDAGLTHANIWTAKGADIAVLRTAVERLLTDVPEVSLLTNTEFRAEVQQTMTDLLAVLQSLQVFACVIAVLGVVTFLLSTVLDRTREIALLRSVGVTRAQVRCAIVLEATLIGVTGALLGILAGIPAAFFMVTHSIRVAMGWSLDFTFPVSLAASTLVTIAIAAAAAGYFPARRLTAGPVLAGLRAE